MGFLTAAREGKDDIAAQYLNTPLRSKAAAVLAQQLFTVLNHRLPPKLNELSDKPEGSPSIPLQPNEDLVGTISSEEGNVDILLERVDRGKSGSLWLFSGKTLNSIPELYDEVNVVSVDTVLPEFLVNTRFMSLPLFEWLVVLVGMPLFYFFTILLNRVVSPLIGLLRRRVSKQQNLPNPGLLPIPVRLLLLAAVIQWLNSRIGLPLLARQFWASTATVITILSCVWLLILLAGWCEKYTLRVLQGRNLTGSTSILRLIRWVVNLVILFTGGLVLLNHFGVNPVGALAGIGVGGIAVALAAQKTLENVIGGASLIFDQAVRVGDTMKVGDTQGTVEDIGLRSTRIRTLDRTLVTVPNGQIANMTLEDISARDKFWFHPILALRYGTTSSQLQSVLHGIRSALEESQQVELRSVRVRFLRFSPSSLDVEVFAYVLARDWSQFLEIQESLFLRILECIESNGVRFAFPLQTIVAAASTSGAVEREMVNVPTSEKESSGNLKAAKSA